MVSVLDFFYGFLGVLVVWGFVTFLSLLGLKFKVVFFPSNEAAIHRGKAV